MPDLLRPAEIPDDVAELLCLLPGYDPIGTAEDDFFHLDAACRAIDFFHTCLKHVEGDLFGQPFILQPWQQSFVANLFGWKRLDEIGRLVRRYIEALLYVPRKNGKALHVDEPIPTPSGWSRMGDLTEGDEVFDENGRRCRVTYATDVMLGHACYRVEFSDGTSIVADAEHLWAVDSRSPDCRQCITTEELRATLFYGARRDRNHSIPVAAAIDCPERPLPVPPYALGVWLGDGHSDGARVTLNEADADQIISQVRGEGVVVRESMAYRKRDAGARQFGLLGIVERLRELEVLHDKHIPAGYLRASLSDRWALLRGLMDTDGHATKRGQAEFTTTVERMAEDLMELVRSVGLKPSLSVHRAMLKGRDMGPKYRVQFWPWRDEPAFSLQRQVDRLKLRPRRRARSQTRQIVAVEPVASVPVRCIKVDSASSLFLAGRGMVPTHNTPLAAGVMNLMLFTDNERGAQIVSAAADAEQAALLYNQASGQVQLCPALDQRARITRAQNQRGILFEEQRSGYKVISAEAHTKHGQTLHAGLIDELHAQPDRELVDTLTTSTASLNRKQALILYMTTADFDRESICNEKHDYACQVRDGIIPDARFLPCIYEATRDDDWTSEDVWAKANPNLGVSVSLEYLRRECKKAQRIPSFQNTFKRLHLNIRTEQAERFIVMEQWDQCARPGLSLESLAGQRCFGGLDLASTRDLNALALYFPDPCALLIFFWIPRDSVVARSRDDNVPYDAWARDGQLRTTEGNVADYDVIRRDINDIGQQVDIQQIGIDRWNGAQLTTQLMADGFEMVQFGQGFASMSGPTKAFERLIVSERLQHEGNPVLRWNASNLAVSRDAADNLKPDKKKSSEKIDGMVASIMAVGRADAEEGEEESVYNERGFIEL